MPRRISTCPDSTSLRPPWAPAAASIFSTAFRSPLAHCCSNSAGMLRPELFPPPDGGPAGAAERTSARMASNILRTCGFASAGRVACGSSARARRKEARACSSSAESALSIPSRTAIWPRSTLVFPDHSLAAAISLSTWSSLPALKYPWITARCGFFAWAGAARASDPDSNHSMQAASFTSPPLLVDAASVDHQLLRRGTHRQRPAVLPPLPTREPHLVIAGGEHRPDGRHVTVRAGSLELVPVHEHLAFGDGAEQHLVERGVDGGGLVGLHRDRLRAPEDRVTHPPGELDLHLP